VDFYCFLNFFTPKLYRFPHKKMNNFMLWKFVQQRLRTLMATWPIHFRHLLCTLFLQTLPRRHKLEAVSEKISKQLWFQLHSDTVHVGYTIHSLPSVTAHEVSKLSHKSPLKSSSMDTIPTSLLLQCHESFSVIITHLAKLSFSEG